MAKLDCYKGDGKRESEERFPLSHSPYQAISNETGRNRTLLEHKTVVTKLNQLMNGWANYFYLGSASKSYRTVDQHACQRLRQWLCAKQKVSWPATRKFPPASFNDWFGLVRLNERTRSFS
jgi:hypothetical protein